MKKLLTLILVISFFTSAQAQKGINLIENAKSGKYEEINQSTKIWSWQFQEKHSYVFETIDISENQVEKNCETESAQDVEEPSGAREILNPDDEAIDPQLARQSEGAVGDWLATQIVELAHDLLRQIVPLCLGAQTPEVLVRTSGENSSFRRE